jgi:Ca2+-binding RTX toxin-like protein
VLITTQAVDLPTITSPATSAPASAIVAQFNGITALGSIPIASLTPGYYTANAGSTVQSSHQYLTLTQPTSVTFGGSTYTVTSMTVSQPTGSTAATLLGFFSGASVPENDEVVNCNWLVGGNGDDNLTASPVGSTIEGGPGNDTITGGPGNDTLYGDYGCDTINGMGGTNTIDSGNEMYAAKTDPLFGSLATLDLSAVEACGQTGAPAAETLTGGTSDSDGNLCVCEDTTLSCTQTNCSL